MPVLQPERLRDEEFLDALRALDADLGVVAAYGKILTDAVLADCRGSAASTSTRRCCRSIAARRPIHRAVMAGDAETGVTIMRVVKALDAGPMLRRSLAPIGPDETSAEVERDLAVLGADALVEAVDALAEGRAIEDAAGRARGDLRATSSRRPTGIVDWSRPARDDSQSDSRPASLAARLQRSGRRAD